MLLEGCNLMNLSLLHVSCGYHLVLLATFFKTYSITDSSLDNRVVQGLLILGFLAVQAGFLFVVLLYMCVLKNDGVVRLLAMVLSIFGGK